MHAHVCVCARVYARVHVCVCVYVDVHLSVEVCVHGHRCGVLCCVILSPPLSMKFCIGVNYEATAARSSMSCQCGLIVCCGCPVGIISFFD